MLKCHERVYPTFFSLKDIIMNKFFLKEFSEITKIKYNEYTQTISIYGLDFYGDNRIKLVQREDCDYCLFYEDVNSNLDPVALKALTKKDLSFIISEYKKHEENKFERLNKFLSKMK